MPLEDLLCLQFIQVADSLSSGLKSHFNDYGISFTEWTILYFLSSNKMTCARDIAAALRIKKSFMTKLLNRLEEKSLVERTGPLNDPFSKGIILTPMGKALVPVLAKIVEEFDRQIFSSPEQRENLFATLEKIRS